MKLLHTLQAFILCALVSVFSIGCKPPAGDNGLLRATFEHGQAVYLTDRLDPNGVEIHWDHMPIRYYVDGDYKLISRAAREWNSQLRFTAFVPGTEADADVYISTGQPFYATDSINNEVEARIGGQTHHTLLQGRLQANVKIAEVGSNRLEYIITVHELGHVLGLDDDDFNDSVMRKYQVDDSDVSWDSPANSSTLTFATWISDNDKRLLRNLYKSQR